MKASLGAAFVAAMATLPAQASFVTFSEWESFDAARRAVYIAGAMDSYFAFNFTEAPAKHFSECIDRLKMNSAQLAENVLAFVKARPNLQDQEVPPMALQYLRLTCGPPPGE